MRIHELLEITHDQYLLEFSQNLTLDELSGYTYRRPAVKPQLKRAMQAARKSTSRVKKTAGKVRRVAKKSVNAAAVRAQRQQAAQKQKQAAQAKQATQAIQAATPYAPIKYRKPLIRNQHPAQPTQPQQQPKPTPAPVSITTKIGGVGDLKDLGAQANMILPKDKRSDIKPWGIDNS
jgi:ATPase subunit of ABC transporter with duplicated ATPase domains